MMLYILLFMLFWWMCGVLNVAGTQAFSPNPRVAFDYYNRRSTLGLCFCAGPVLTVCGLVCLLAVGLYKCEVTTPFVGLVKYSTRWGRALGRLINPDNE